MKHLFMIWFFGLVSAFSFAQDTGQAVWSHQLEDNAWQKWDSINTHWMNNVYYSCLKANKLKMSCASCVYIYIDAEFTVDSAGKLTNIKIIKENICSRRATEKLINCFFDYFRNLTFPQPLRQKRIISKFGTGLKC
jgi:hypothetical protein